jgi:hypothetical protein
LNYLQYTFSNFRYGLFYSRNSLFIIVLIVFPEKCKSAYLSCLEALQLQAKLETAQTTRRKSSKMQVYIFLRLTTFMRESGYHELSIALWQAVLEFILLRPPAVSETTALEDFSSYWDSERPRLGELGHQGWSQYLEQPDNDVAPDPLEILPEEISETEQLFQRFGSSEVRMAEKLSLPGRIADEAGEDDPFHAILFSDLSPFVSCFLPDFQARSALIAGFSCYFGLPPFPVNTEGGCLEWWQDGFLRSHISSLWTIQNPGSDTRSLPKLELVQMTTEELFYGAYRTELPFPLQPEWVERALQTLVQHHSSDEILAEYFLAFAMKQKSSLYVEFP